MIQFYGVNRIYMICFQAMDVTDSCPDGGVQLIVNETATKCCSTCKKGSGVVSECSLTNNTQCQQCIPGKSYSDVDSHDSPCKPCATCDNNTNFILHPCNETMNTICGCPNGKYYDQETDRCKLCDLCPAGWGALRMCNKNHNTICTPCTVNVTFSHRMDYYSKCTPCSKCVDPYIALQDCSITEDAICMSK